MREALRVTIGLRVIARDIEVDGAVRWDEELANSDDTMPFRVRSEDLALIMYTSGTTARPKGVMYSHANILQCGINMANGFDWRPDERLLHQFPLYHVNGGMTQLTPTLLRGSVMVLIPKFTASGFTRLLREHEITITFVNATHVKMLLRTPSSGRDSEHPCRRMVFGLSLDTAEIKAFERRFATRCIGTYGLTESLSATVIAPADFELDPESAGRSIPGYQLRIEDSEGAELAPGEAGEIVVRAVSQHGLAMGYWRADEATARTFVDGWLHTGDIGFVDQFGALHYLQRAKDMIKRAGYNVAPAEVERVLLQHPSVRETAVVSAPDEIREEAIVAFVVLDHDVAASELIDHCLTQLAAYKVPEHVIVLDSLPEDTLGKVDRKLLRGLAADRVATASS